jgi:hypothetical protein
MTISPETEHTMQLPSTIAKTLVTQRQPVARGGAGRRTPR